MSDSKIKSKKKKYGVLEICILVGKILLCAMLLINFYIFVVYGLLNRGNIMEGEDVWFVNGWTVADGAEGEKTLSATLPRDVSNNDCFYFKTRKDTAVYINNELRKDYIEKRDVNIPGGALRSFLMSVPLSEADSGAEIKISSRFVQEDLDDISEAFIGSFSETLRYMVKKEGLSVTLALIVMIFSLVAFVVSFVLQMLYMQRINMMYGALGICSIAAWLITDSNLFSFILGVDHISGLLSNTLCLVIPLPLAIFLTSIQRGRHRKSMSVVLVVSILNAVIWPFLHYTGLVHFNKVRDLANAVLVFLVVTGMVILIVDAVKGNVSEYRYTFIGMLGFLVGCLIELTNIIFDMNFIKESVAMVVGLAFMLTFIVIQQVHDLRKINMEKQHAMDISEAKTNFLASMSHEIRTPINAILGMNEMILRENNDNNIDEYSRNIKNSGKMLLMLVNDVLDFTKIEAGKLEINESDFLMSDMLADVISLIRERAEEKELELGTEITGEVPNVVESDEFRIKQILVNLMNNAVKYTEKGTVTLKVGGNRTDEGYELLLAVVDTGKGIRKEDQEHLFEAFSRADLKSNANIEGTGLGLAIVKSIVDSMNGEIGVISEYGEGSEFWVKLPMKCKGVELLGSDFMERRREKQVVAESAGFTAPDAKILAVDDNQSNLTIVRLFLKQNGIVPDLCSSGLRAVKLCKEKKYDLILLDHMMPAPDGIETLHLIREDEASLNKDTKAIVLTANAVAGSRQMYLKEGFDDYLTKPLDSKVLEETVRTMLPEEKVLEGTGKTDELQAKPQHKTQAETLTESAEKTEDAKGNNEDSEVRSHIEGLDYDTALAYCAGNEDFLREIIGDVVKECRARSERMRKSVEENDIRAYKIDAHTIKSSMATIGMSEFSEKAKQHEYAAKDNNIDFIKENAETFIGEYEDICRKLEKYYCR